MCVCVLISNSKHNREENNVGGWLHFAQKSIDKICQPASVRVACQAVVWCVGPVTSVVFYVFFFISYKKRPGRGVAWRARHIITSQRRRLAQKGNCTVRACVCVFAGRSKTKTNLHPPHTPRSVCVCVSAVCVLECVGRVGERGEAREMCRHCVASYE